MEQETTHPTPKKSISTGAAIVTAAVIIGIAIVIAFGPKSASNGTPANNVQQPAEVTSVPADVAKIRQSDRIRGDAATAQVAVIEYSDSDCPYCARFHTTMQDIVEEYNGKVAWVYRYFPLASLHPNATTEAVALECVADLGGNDDFNKYLDILINTTLNADPKSNETLTTFAMAQGIRDDLFTACMKGTKAAARVKADTEEAQKIGAQGTPFSIIVNLKSGKQAIVPGAYGIEEVKAKIDSVLR